MLANSNLQHRTSLQSFRCVRPAAERKCAKKSTYECNAKAAYCVLLTEYWVLCTACCVLRTASSELSTYKGYFFLLRCLLPCVISTACECWLLVTESTTLSTEYCLLSNVCRVLLAEYWVVLTESTSYYPVYSLLFAECWVLLTRDAPDFRASHIISYKCHFLFWAERKKNMAILKYAKVAFTPDSESGRSVDQTHRRIITFCRSSPVCKSRTGFAAMTSWVI